MIDGFICLSKPLIFYDYYFSLIVTLNIFSLSDEKLGELIADSNLLDKRKTDFEERKNNAVESLKCIVRTKSTYINVFRLDNEEAGQDIEIIILRAFLNSN